jgi:hypothetical protein
MRHDAAQIAFEQKERDLLWGMRLLPLEFC